MASASTGNPKPLGIAAITCGISVIAIIAALYGSGLRELVSEWQSPEHSQGIVVAPFALFMAWLVRKRIAAITPICELRGLFLVGLGCLTHLLGVLGVGQYASQVSFILVVAGLIWTFWGARRLRLLVLPLLLFVTTIPLPGMVYTSLSIRLQLITTRIACWIADLAGVTVYREGNIIHLAAISLGVWEACNGLTSLAALLVGALLLGFMLCEMPLTRFLVFAAATPVAIVVNIGRVAGTAILSDRNPVYAMGFYHAFSGWLVFVLGFAGLYGVTLGLRRMVGEK